MFVTIFYCDYYDKLITTSLPINSAPPIAKSIVKLRAEIFSIQQKCSQPANNISKRTKKS